MLYRPKLLFICTANICRSAWAEHRARALLGQHFEVSSAGTVGFTDHPMDPVMAATLPGGVPQHHSRAMTYQIIDDADLILTMESSHRLIISDEFPAVISKTFTLGQFAQTLQEAPRRLSFPDLLTWSYQHRVMPSRSTDVADPYGKGEQAAQACAQLLEQLLQDVAPMLRNAQQRQQP